MAIDPQRIFAVQERLIYLIGTLRNPAIKSVKRARPRSHWDNMPASAVEYDWLYPVRFATNRMTDYQYVWFVFFAFADMNSEIARDELLITSAGFTNALNEDLANHDSADALGELIAKFEVTEVTPADYFNPENGNPQLVKQIRFAAEMEAAT